MIVIDGRMFEDDLCWGVFRKGNSGHFLAPMSEGEDAVFVTQEEAKAWRDSNLRSGRIAPVRFGSFGWEEMGSK